ncbi:LysR family transcriptional regulator [Halomonas campisalis]|uniref:LysR family transcriptional regulator n=2 Tax=Billgrantia campisalis TaxID=74661 RepID=A0ABS9PAL8_9GAMM|nr:LysR family transcriptional regulator [Halomonas campisalis]MCG6658810.1 LysR family transcriptional regulator [Halomonas campisalis]MDR5864773.1 LysR family transcriptional regulator [Halomonas campisalis]
MYDLAELTSFAQVMQTGSLTRSAQQLGVAKSTLSRRIAQLENQLGQPLLRRQSNRLLPTEAGLMFHGYCLRILELAEQGQRALNELHQEISGELVVEAHNALARSWLASQLAAFMEAHPGIRLTLQTCHAPPDAPDSPVICLWLGAIPPSALRQETLTWLGRGLYGHPDYLARHGHPRHPEELSRHAWIDLLGETECGLTLSHPDEGDYHFQPPDSRFRVDQHMLHGDAIARGHGLGLMPHWLAAKREAAHPGSLHACLPDWQAPPIPVTLLHAYGQQPRKVSALLDHLRQTMPQEWQSSPRGGAPSRPPRLAPA